MNRYHFNLTCPKDGGELEHVAGGKPSATETRAVAKCIACNRSWVVLVSMLLSEGHAARLKRKQRGRQRAS